MRKYSSYKGTSVEWVGEIPSHWEKKKLSYLMENDGFRSGPFGSSLITSELLEKGEVQVLSPEFISKGFEEFPLFVPKEREKELSKYLVKQGDIIIPIVGTLGRGKIITSEDPKGILNQRLCKITPNQKKINLILLHKLLTESNIIKVQYQLEKRGSILDHITKEILYNLILPVPPLSEQQKIVEFLDDKTQKIDNLIQQKEKKIELLKEKRISLINHIVTKGLNPNVEMKDSGVEWIGEIPSHWNKTKMKYVVEIYGRIGYRGYTTEDIVDEGQGVITISPSNIKDDKFSIDNSTYLSWEKYYESPEIQIFENDIILVKTGSTIGKTSIIPSGLSEMTINPQLVVLKNIQLYPRYLFYQTICKYIKESFDIEQTGSTTPTISQEKINEFPILTPPLNEQQKIVDYLDEQTKEIDDLVELEQKKIELLKEYRQSLISEVVTGKIRVCEEDLSEIN